MIGNFGKVAPIIRIKNFPSRENVINDFKSFITKFHSLPFNSFDVSSPKEPQQCLHLKLHFSVNITQQSWGTKNFSLISLIYIII